MSNRLKPKYVSVKQIKNIKANYTILLGERSNGKSFACKSYAFQECYKNGHEMIVLKRFDLEIKDSMIVNYFSDVPIQEITEGAYTCIDVFRKEIYLSNIDEKTQKVVHGKKIGYVHSLASDEHYKSLSFPKVRFILFEEIVSKDGRYLFNECDRLQHYISTIYRNNVTDGRVIMIGNTISRICPYYSEWQLDKIPRQKQGTVDYYIKHNDNGADTTIAVFLTDSLNINTGMFFGNSAKTITKGAYEVNSYPHLPESLHRYKILYQFVLEYENFKFLCQLLEHYEHSDQITWYIQPKTSDIKNNTRVFSNKYSLDPLYSTSFKMAYESEKRVISMLLNGQVCYSDNLTGTEFNNLLHNFT